MNIPPSNAFQILCYDGYHQHATHKNAHGRACSGDSHSINAAKSNKKEVDAFPSGVNKE